MIIKHGSGRKDHNLYAWDLDKGWRCEQEFIDWAAGKGYSDEFEQYAQDVWLTAQLKELFLQDVFGKDHSS